MNCVLFCFGFLQEAERLPHSDLIVDVEEEQAMTAETDAQVAEVRQELHYASMKNVLAKERIKVCPVDKRVIHDDWKILIYAK